MRKLASIALLTGLGIAAAVASATAEARPYVEVLVGPPGLYVPYIRPYGGPYYAHGPYGYQGYGRYGYGYGYGPHGFHRDGDFHGGHWHR